MRLPLVCEDDPLRTARGILYGVLISVVIWTLGVTLAVVVVLLGG